MAGQGARPVGQPHDDDLDAIGRALGVDVSVPTRHVLPAGAHERVGVLLGGGGEIRGRYAASRQHADAVRDFRGNELVAR